MNKSLLFPVTFMLLGSRVVFASDAGQMAIGELEPLVVTATRTAETADESLASVTVITRQDIERQQARSVQDLLRGVPGISIANNGGSGKNTSVFLRGTESDHVLVLIDGIKMGSVTTGTTAFQHIPIDQVERIEIVRGPRSSLYGSEAIGGVIQIFTRRGGGALKPSFSMGAGNYSTFDASFGISGGGERSWFNLTVSSFDTDGFDACEGNLSGGGCSTDEPDEDGYRNLSGSLHGGYRLENGLEIDAHLLHSDSHTEYDGTSTNKSDGTQQTVGMTFRYSPAENWKLALAAGRSQDKSKHFKDRLFKNRFDTERDSLSLQNDIVVEEDHLLTVGVDYQDDRADSTAPYSVTSRDSKGLYLQYQGGIGDHEIQLGLREDDNEQFDRRTTGGLAWGYPLNEKLRITASWGTAFKAPTFNELYWPGYGNPDLRPEESRSFELGVREKLAWGSWSASIYETSIDELIAYDAAVSAPGNVDEARIQGLEATAAAKIRSWSITTGLSLLKPENRSKGENRGNILPRRAEQSLRLDADRTFGRYSVGGTLLVEGRRYDDLANTRKLDSYTVFDLRAGYRIDDTWLLQARIENLFDEEYQTAAFYNQPGRSLYLTLRYQP